MDRRKFLSALSCSLAGFDSISNLLIQAGTGRTAISQDSSCWLEICAPFISEGSDAGFSSDIVLTSDSFAGIDGHSDNAQSSNYEIYLYDASGKAIRTDGPTKSIMVQAMRTTVVEAKDLIGDSAGFWGGMRIRLRPNGTKLKHASDLFSSAFVRWRNDRSWDNVHANPDPPQWQNTSAFFYSMPFPSLDDYDCFFSLFNSGSERSAGKITLYAGDGKVLALESYELKPRASLIFDMNAGRVSDLKSQGVKSKIKSHGLIAITNDAGTSKGFGYLMIRHKDHGRFSVEHPIHQGIFIPKDASAPFDENKQFRAKNVLYSPLLFNGKRFGDITLDTRYYFGTGLPLEQSQWLYPFAIDGDGNAVWSAMNDQKLVSVLPGQTEKGVIRLPAYQSCQLDIRKLSFPSNFSGGLGVAVAPDISHTLQKVEVRIPEWSAHAFTHFRPGLRSARSYAKSEHRGAVATDYIVSGARLTRKKTDILFDEIVCLVNIDDRGVEGMPTLELFNSDGLYRRIHPGKVPAFACRHYMLSQLLNEEIDTGLMSIRLVDSQATMLMSTVHLDYGRRDIALDHGSDRFSTYLDYGCRL